MRLLEEAGAGIILGNTYHLWLRPGDELIARRGGLHRFTGWTGPLLTDSGGYQVFSLAARRTVEEEGVHFRSHLDGSALLLTPERAVDIQARLGSDIAMVLDECPPHPSPREAIRTSLELTTRWAGRCRTRLDAIRGGAADVPSPSTPGQAQFGIVQGGVFADLRDGERRAAGGDGLRRLRPRRPQRRGTSRPDVRRGERDGAAPAGGQAALPDGGRAPRRISSRQ